MLYSISNWDRIFENNRSREIKELNWVAIPNRHDGSKFAELMSHKNGAQHFAAWILIVQVASRVRDSRGILRRGDGTPHTPLSLSLVTRCPETVFLEAIPRLLSLGWLELEGKEQIPQLGAGIPQLGAVEGKGTGVNGTEQKEHPAGLPVKSLRIKKKEPEPKLEVLAVYEFYKNQIKPSTRKADALKWIESRGLEHGFERLVMSIAIYMLKCKELQTKNEYKKDCANFFGEDAAFEGYLPDENFYSAFIKKSNNILGRVNVEA